MAQLDLAPLSRLLAAFGRMVRTSGVPRIVALGLLPALLLMAMLALSSGVVLSRDRFDHVLAEAYADKQLEPYEHRDEDYFTDCSLMVMNYGYVHHSSFLLNAIDTRLISYAPYRHPCESLQVISAHPPLPCDAASDTQSCAAMITWSTNKVGAAKITVQDIEGREAETVLGQSVSGSRLSLIPKTVVFRLYDTSTNAPELIASLVVQQTDLVTIDNTTNGTLGASTPHQVVLGPPTFYVNYWFGSRHLEAVVLSILSLAHAKSFYALLSYGSLILLLTAVWRNSKTQAIIISPIILFLLIAFSLHLLGHNLAHAPGFFVGFLTLAFFVAMPTWFQKRGNRFSLYIFLGLVVSFFDVLSGPLPVILSLTIVLAHICYVAPYCEAREITPTKYLFEAVLEGVGIFACVFLAYVLLTGSHLLILSTFQANVWHAYFYELTFRMGNNAEGTGIVQLSDVIHRLWLARAQLMSQGAASVTWLLFASACAWAFAACMTPVAALQSGRRARFLLVDLLVTTAAGGGILVWFVAFQNHTYVHADFMVRLVTLPASYGLVAMILVLQFLLRNESLTMRWAAIPSSVISVFIVAWLMHNIWLVATTYDAKVVTDVSTDAVACAPRGTTPDGKSDGLIEIVAKSTPPPLAMFHLRKEEGTVRRRGMILQRDNPAGVYGILTDNYVLGVSLTPNGALLNDGKDKIAISDQSRFYLHFCRDGHDEDNSVYYFTMDGQARTMVDGH